MKFYREGVCGSSRSGSNMSSAGIITLALRALKTHRDDKRYY